jgi:hypothetical protein
MEMYAQDLPRRLNALRWQCSVQQDVGGRSGGTNDLCGEHFLKQWLCADAPLGAIGPPCRHTNLWAVASVANVARCGAQ